MEHHKASRTASRLGLAVASGMVVVVLIVVLVSTVSRGLGHWVDRQPRYLTRFRELVLEPPPPPWYRGGAPTFLDRVRQDALLQDEPFSVLKCDLGKLKEDFQKCAWVEGVDRVRRLSPDRDHGARIAVQLRYYEPVGVAKLPDHSEVLLDREARLLPADDIDRGLAGPLLPIEKLPPPHAPRFGEVWKEKGPTETIARESRRASDAAKLAAFLKSTLRRNAEDARLSQALLISFSNRQEPFVRFARPNHWLLWGEAPGEESPGQPTALEKWGILEKWVRETGPHSLKYPNFLFFRGSKLQIVEGIAPTSLVD